MNQNQKPKSSASAGNDHSKSKVKERKISSNLRKSTGNTNLLKRNCTPTTTTTNTTTTTHSPSTSTTYYSTPTSTNTTTTTPNPSTNTTTTILGNYENENSIMLRTWKNNSFDPMSLGIYNTGPYSFSTFKNSITKRNLTQQTTVTSLRSHDTSSLFNELYSSITNLIQEYEIDKVGKGEDQIRRIRLMRDLETNSSLIASESDHQYEHDQSGHDIDFNHDSFQRDIDNLIDQDESNFEMQIHGDGQILDGNGNNVQTIYKPLNFHWPVLDVIQEEVESDHRKIKEPKKFRKLFQSKYKKYPIGRVHNPVLDVIHEQEDDYGYGHENAHQNLVENTSTSSVSTNSNSVVTCDYDSETYLEHQDSKIPTKLHEPELLNEGFRIHYGDYGDFQTEVESTMEQLEEPSSVDPISAIQIQTISQGYICSNEIGLGDFLKQVVQEQEIKSNTETESDQIVFNIEDKIEHQELYDSELELVYEQFRIRMYGNYDYPTQTTISTTTEVESILKQIEEPSSVDPISVIQTISQDYTCSNEIGLGDFLKPEVQDQEIKSNIETECDQIVQYNIEDKIESILENLESSFKDIINNCICSNEKGDPDTDTDTDKLIKSLENHEEPSSELVESESECSIVSVSNSISSTSTISMSESCYQDINIESEVFTTCSLENLDVSLDQTQTLNESEDISSHEYEQQVSNNAGVIPDSEVFNYSIQIQNQNLAKQDQIKKESQVFSKCSFENLVLSLDQTQDKSEDFSSHEQQVSNNAGVIPASKVLSNYSIQIQNLAKQDQFPDSFNLNSKDIVHEAHFNSDEEGRTRTNSKIDKEHVERYIQEYKSRISENLTTFRKNPLDQSQSQEAAADVSRYLFCDSPSFSQCSLNSQSQSVKVNKVEQIFLNETGESLKISKISNAQNYPEFRVISLDETESNELTNCTSSSSTNTTNKSFNKVKQQIFLSKSGESSKKSKKSNAQNHPGFQVISLESERYNLTNYTSTTSISVPKVESKIEEIDQANFLPNHEDENERLTKISPTREKKAHIVTKPCPNHPSTNIITLRKDSKPKSQEELSQFIQEKSFEIIRAMVTYLILTCPTPKPNSKPDSNHRKPS